MPSYNSTPNTADSTPSIHFMTPLLIAFVLIPTFGFLFAQAFIALYNPHGEADALSRVLDGLSVRGIVIYIVLITFSVILIYRLLSPLQKFCSMPNISSRETFRQKARTASLKIPYILLLFHGVFWALGPTILYGIKGFHIPDRNPYLEVLFTNFGFGMWSAVSSILFINTLLFKPKIMLQMTDIRKHAGERDFSTQTKVMLLIIVVGFLSFSIFGQLGYYYSIAGYEGKGMPTYNESWLIGLIIVAVFVSFVYVFNYREFNQSVWLLKDKIRELVSGEADLTQRVFVVSFNEIGEIAVEMNQFILTWNQILLKVKRTASTVEEGSTNLTQLVSKATDVIQTFHDLNEALQNEAIRQKEQSTLTQHSIKEVTQSIHIISDRIQEQATLVEQVSASVEEMVSTIQEMGKNVSSSSLAANELSRLAQQSRSVLINSVEAFKSIEEASSQVKTHIDNIGTIADQTNVLAMNASIEAARAGTVGKGFAVVASEIRKLATVSRTAVQDSFQVIETMTDRVDNGKALIQQVDEDLHEMFTFVESTTQNLVEVNGFISEHQTGADEMLKAINHLVDATEQITEQTQNQHEKSETVMNASYSFMDSVQMLVQRAETQREKTQIMEEMRTFLHDIATNNQTAIHSMMETINRIKLKDDHATENQAQSLTKIS